MPCADDTAANEAAKNTAEVIGNFTSITQKLFTCFANNQMQTLINVTY